MWETWVRSLDWEDTLEKGKTTLFNILAWRIPWTILSMGLQELDTTEWLSLSLGTVLAPLGVSFTLQIEDQGLLELYLFGWILILDPFDFNWFILCLWAMSFFQKLCSAPFLAVSCSFPELLPGPQFCLHSLLEGQPENSWTLGGKYYIIQSP